MANKEFWDKLTDDIITMSDEEFLNLVEEAEKIPDLPITLRDEQELQEFSLIIDKPKFEISFSVKFTLLKEIIYDDFDRAYVA